MMRTEDDLRTLLHAPIGSDAAERVLADIVADTPVRIASRRPARLAASAVLAMAIVVGTVVAVIAVRSDPRPTPATPVASTPDDAPFDLAADTSVVSFPAGSGYRVASVELSTVAQSAGIVADGSSEVVAWVRLLELGDRFPAVPVPNRDSVQLPSGATASWIPSDSGTAIPLGDSLRWMLSGGLVVTVTPTFDGASDAIVAEVARAVQIGSHAPVRVPFAVSHWPAGLALTGITTDDERVSVSAGPHVRIRMFGTGIKGVDPDRGTPVVIQGRTWHWDASIGVLTWGGTDRVVQVGPETSSEAQFVTRSEMEDLAGALTFAPSFTDTSTWFDSTTAFSS